MTSTWQIYQTRLAALLREQPPPAPSWPRCAARIRCQPTLRVGNDRHTSITQLVRLPGIWRPDWALLPVPVR